MRGEEVTPATDVYALGVIAYEMLTGARPHDGANQATLITQALTQSPVSPAARRGDLPAGVDDAVMRALAKEPAHALEVGGGVRGCAVAAAAGPHGIRRAPSRQPAPETGLLAKYELGPLLGRGRLGSLVYTGTHRALGVEVAIRVLKRDEQPNWDVVRARFLLEARTLQVSHPSLLQVRDFAEDDRAVYVVTDLIQGPSLRQAMAEAGAMPWPRAANLLEQALERCRRAESQGRFHLRRESRHDPPSRVTADRLRRSDRHDDRRHSLGVRMCWRRCASRSCEGRKPASRSCRTSRPKS